MAQWNNAVHNQNCQIELKPNKVFSSQWNYLAQFQIFHKFINCSFICKLIQSLFKAGKINKNHILASEREQNKIIHKIMQ